MKAFLRRVGRVVLVALLVLGAALVWRELKPGRYEVVASGGILHRLDTATGELQAFTLESAYSNVDPARYRYWPMTYTTAQPERVRTMVDQADGSAAAK